VARYRGLKGKYWTLFSEYVRRRDFIAYGRCVSCNEGISDWRYADAGHFIAAGRCGFALLFDPLNVNLQCKRCNNPRWRPDAGAFYYRGLDARYGAGTAATLQQRYDDVHFKGKTTKEWSKREYEAKIVEIKEKKAAL